MQNKCKETNAHEFDWLLDPFQASWDLEIVLSHGGQQIRIAKLARFKARPEITTEGRRGLVKAARGRSWLPLERHKARDRLASRRRSGGRGDGALAISRTRGERRRCGASPCARKALTQEGLEAIV
jgi:hypothetical protein